MKLQSNTKIQVMKNWIVDTITVTKLTYFAALAAGLFLTSCELFEDIQEDVQPVVDFIEDITEIQEGLEDAMTLSEDALTITLDDGTAGYLVGVCATVTNDPEADILRIDFGSEPCEGVDGKKRAGTIIINYIDEEDAEAYSYSIDFEDYEIDENTYEGRLTVDLLHRNEDGKLEFSEKVEDARMTFANATWYEWNSERTRTMINGESSSDVKDDVFQITGFFEGRDNEGNEFNSEVKRPITFFRSCWEEGIIYPSSGRTRVEMTGKPATDVDWGLGFCNKVVNILQFDKWLILELD